MLVENEYLKTPCYYCAAKQMRRKQKGDWTQGEIMRTGQHTYADYFICDNCNRSCMTMKGATPYILVALTFQTFLTGWAY